jgi:uncharacterized OsmC-like protein
MKTSEVTYLGSMRTSAHHLKSGQTIITDAPTDNHGRGEAFSPTDLLATSLGSCMLTIMGIVAERNSLNIEGAKLEVTKIMEANPRRVGEIQIDITMPAMNYSQKDKDLLENAAHTCPVAKSLSAELIQTIKFNWE